MVTYGHDHTSASFKYCRRYLCEDGRVPGNRRAQPHGGAIDNEPIDPDEWFGPRALPQTALPPEPQGELARAAITGIRQLDDGSIGIPAPRVPYTLLTVERQAYVELLWRMLYSEDEICEIITERFVPIGRRDDVTVRAIVRRDMKVIEQKYAALETDPNVLINRKRRHRAALEFLYRDSLAARDRTNAGKTLDRIAKLDGLYAPIKIDVTSNVKTVGVEIDKVIAALDARGLEAFELVLAQLDKAGIAVKDGGEPPSLPELVPAV